MDNFQEDYAHPDITLADPSKVFDDVRHPRFESIDSNRGQPTRQDQRLGLVVQSPDSQPLQCEHIS